MTYPIPMPGDTQREHLDPYWLGDSKIGCEHAASKPLGPDGLRCWDVNGQPLADDEACLHWNTARKNGYYFMQNPVTRRRRPMTQEELDRPTEKWTKRGVKRWRRTKQRDKRFESRVRPLFFREMMRMCKKKGVTPCYELKHPIFGKEPQRIRRMQAYADSIRWTVYFMSLVTMVGWQRKAEAVHSVPNGQFALMAHGARRPPDLNNYRNIITRIWNTFADGGKWHA